MRPLPLFVVLIWIAMLVAHQEYAKAAPTNPLKTELERTFKPGKSPNDVAWSPDGKLLATADGLNTQIVIWDYAKGSALHRIYRRYFGISSLVFTADGKFIITSAALPTGPHNRLALSVIDAATGKIVRDVQGPFDNPEYISQNIADKFAVSQKYAAIVTKTHGPDCLIFYDASTWSVLGKYVCNQHVAKLAFIPNSNNLAVLGIGGQLDVWNLQSGDIVKSLKAQSPAASALAVDNSGLAATANGNGPSFFKPDPDPLRIWDIATGSLVRSAFQPSGEDYRARSLSFSADGRLLASLNEDGRVRLWDTKTLSLIGIVDEGGKGGVEVSFSPTGRLLAVVRNTSVNVVRIVDATARP